MAKPLSVVRAAREADEAIAAEAARLRGADTPVPDSPPLDTSENDESGGALAGNLFQPAPAPAAEEEDDAAYIAEVPANDGQTREVDYEHRFRVLEGKYKAETARMRAELAETTGRLSQMTELLAVMPARREPAEPVPPPEPTVAVTPLNQREIDEFGGDMLDASARFTLARLMPVIDGLKAQVAQLTAQVAQASATATSTASTVAMSARERMFALLDEHEPDWRTINLSDEFKEWLAQEDVMSGETRHALLLRAFERNDGPRVRRFFVAYKAESAAGHESATRKPSRADPPPAPAVVSPSALVAPGRGRAAPAPSTLPKPEWTPQLIAAFYSDVRNGLFRNRDDERQRIEADIFAAQREGRVIT